MDFSKYTMQSEYFYNLSQEVGCTFACVGVNCRSEQYPCHCEDSFMALIPPCHCEECNDEAIQTNHEQSTSCCPEQNPCHSEFISESISFETEKSNLKDKFYTLSVDKMLNILNQLKTPHFMLQHDMFICHCEECNDEAIQRTTESRGVECQ